MNIAIFETEYAHETAYTLIRLFDVPENSIHIYTNLYGFERLSDYLEKDIHRFKWTVKNDDESHFRFIRRFGKLLSSSKPDILVYNTISNNYLLHALMLRRFSPTRTILTVCNVNATLRPDWHLGLRSIATALGRKMLVKYISEFNVISETMVKALKAGIPPSKKIHCIPGSVFENARKKVALAHFLTVVIPGSVEKKRKDYDQALELADVFESRKCSLNIILAGKPFGEYGDRILNECRSRSGEYAAVTTFRSSIGQIQFDTLIRQAHFVWLPLHIETYGEGSKEYYGRTKFSGGVYDAIRHAKPMIVPSELKLPAQMEESVFRYRSVEDLADFLLALSREPQRYSQWALLASQTAHRYSITNVRTQNPSLFVVNRNLS